VSKSLPLPEPIAAGLQIASGMGVTPTEHYTNRSRALIPRRPKRTVGGDERRDAYVEARAADR